MKKVQANWLSQGKPKQAEYNSLDDLIEKESYVGFIPENLKERFIVLTGGGKDIMGFAVTPVDCWATQERQKTTEGQYFIFDTYSELLDWMKG